VSTPRKSHPAPKRALRPREIRERYGIPQSTLHWYCTALPAAERLPSVLLPSRGRKAKKGCRLIFEAELEAWLERHRQPTTLSA
jgi:hypothetical protein